MATTPPALPLVAASASTSAAAPTSAAAATPASISASAAPSPGAAATAGGGLVRAVAVVTFDVDAGQTPLFSHPPGALSLHELKSIAYLALPDSNTSVLQDLVYCFRVRSDSLPLFASTPLNHAYSFGAALFRQRRDAAVRRGFVQVRGRTRGVCNYPHPPTHTRTHT